MKLILIIIFIIFISSLIMEISYSLSLKKKNDFKKNTPFECGFDSSSSSRIPFSLQFYTIMIIFLIFDVELILLIPMLKSLYNSNFFYWMFTSIFLIFILLMGIYFEWINGILNWSV